MRAADVVSINHVWSCALECIHAFQAGSSAEPYDMAWSGNAVTIFQPCGFASLLVLTTSMSI